MYKDRVMSETKKISKHSDPFLAMHLDWSNLGYHFWQKIPT